MEDGSLATHHRDGAPVREGLPWHKPFYRSPLTPTIEPIGQRTGLSQAKKLPGRVQPHPSAENWIKALLNKALHQCKTKLFTPTVPPIRRLAQAS